MSEEQQLGYIKMRDQEKAKATQICKDTNSENLEASGSALSKMITNEYKRVLISRVVNIETKYLNRYQGFDDIGDDGALHNTLRRIQSGEIMDMDRIEWAYRALDYRRNQMYKADTYLQTMGIAMPKGQLCSEYSINKIRKDVGEDVYSMTIRLIFDCDILFPYPIGRQGRPFYKCIHSLIAAFHYENLPMTAIVENLAALTATLDQELELVT